MELGFRVDDTRWNLMLKAAKEFDLAEFIHSWDQTLANDPGSQNRLQGVIDAEKANPFCYFYTDAGTHRMVYRLYGITESEDGIFGYHACTAHLGWTNDIVGGLKAEDIVRVKKWSAKHLQTIRMNNVPERFLIPSGWIEFALETYS